jgi:DNA-binding beta-propeller fold protein YncE
MKQTKVFKPLTRLVLIVALTLLPLTTHADSSWQWQMSLRIDKTGDSMYMPSAVAFDPESERYYVVDTGRNRLVSFDREGKLVRAFTADEQLKAPFDMVRLDNGQLWVVEKGRNSLTLIDIKAKKVQPNTLRDGTRLVFPDRIASAGGKLYVLDRASGQVLRLKDDLSVEQRFGCADCSAGLADFVIDRDSILALEPRDKKIYRFHADGTVAATFDLGAEIDFPVSLAVGAAGFVFVLDRHQNRVFAYDEDGSFRYRFLGLGQGAGKLYFPRQLRFDPWGRLCVVDEGNGRVEVYAP